MAVDLEIISNTILKPSSSSPPHSLVPLTIFDWANFNLHVPLLYAFQPPMPTNEVLINGLVKLLNHYPHLAGRLTIDNQCGPSILLNNAGVRLVEARVGTTLAEILPLNPSHEATKLHPPINDGVEELFQIQLNRFSCGGLVIGQTIHHRVADGQSTSLLTLSWAKLVRGLDVYAYHDRAAISIPRNPPMPQYNHRAIEFKENAALAFTPAMADASSSPIVNLVVNFSPAFMTQLKAYVSSSSAGHSYSTFECLMAHVWKKITLARGLGDDEFTQVRCSVNGRARKKPAVPMEYFGNLVLWAHPRLRVKDLLKESHAFVAKTIHDAVASVNSAYFQSFIDFGGSLKREEWEGLAATVPETGNSLCPNVEVDSWLRFQFHELDFGSGGPCAFLPSELPAEGMVAFSPSCKEKGGVDAFIALLEEHVAPFKQISHSLYHSRC